MGMSEFYGPSDRAESLAVLERALDLGIDMLDTADMYGIGDNERLLGELLTRVDRDRVLVATKFGNLRDPANPAWRARRGDAAYVTHACDQSLRRLGVDSIDLYYLHSPDPTVTIEETVGAMARLVSAGKVRYLGLSNVSAAQVRAAHAVHPITAVQAEWSLFVRNEEAALVPTCAELGIGFVAFSPLYRGFLTGALPPVEALADDDMRRRLPRFNGDDGAHNRRLLEPLTAIAHARRATCARVALAWLHRRQDVHGLATVPIPGTRRRERLEENAAAVDLCLTADELASLEPIASQVAGARW